MDTSAFGVALRPYVRLVHAYDHHDVPAGEHIGLPTTDVVLVITPDPALDLSSPAEGRRRMSVCLAGLDDRPSTIHTHGVERGVFVALTPLGLRRLIGVPAPALAGHATEIDDVCTARLGDRLATAVHEAGTADQRREAVVSLLGQSLASGDAAPAPRPEVVRAWQLLQASRGTVRISEVAEDVGWSTRHLTQRFQAELGMTPKRVARLMRFERAVQPLSRGADLSQVALRCGYSDQAHFTREWTALAGMSPTRWRRRDVFANVQDEPAA